MKLRLRALLVAGAVPGGGTCFGDAGGPAFIHGDVVVGTSYGSTSNCRDLGGDQRVDIESVQLWLATLPGLEYLD